MHVPKERAGDDSKRDESKESKRGRDRGSRSPLSNVPTPSRGSRSPSGSVANSERRGSSSALEDLMRRKGIDEAWTALEEMQAQGVATDKYTVSRMLMKTVGDGRARANPQRVYRGISLVEKFIEAQPKDVDEVLFNALLDTCCRMKDLARLEATVKRMKELKVQPSPVTLGILVKTYGQAGDLPKVLQVWSEMEKQRGLANDVTYGCMLDACVKCGHMEKAVEIFQGMREQGKHKNTVLYTTLIKGYGLEKNLPRAFDVFREMAQEGVPYNTITYNSILDACVKCNDLPAAEALLREMMASNSVEPDLITFSTLLKGYCHNADLDKGLQVVEAIKSRGLRCDELVYNTLMDGCVRANDMAAGIGLFEEMVANNLKPSSHTHSILVRLYQRTGYEEDAAEAVAQLYQHHGIDRPTGDARRSSEMGGRSTPAGRGGRAGGRSGSMRSPTESPASSFGGRSRAMSECSEGGWSNCSVPYLPADAFRVPTGVVPPLPPMGTSARDAATYSGQAWGPTASPMNSQYWAAHQGMGVEYVQQGMSVAQSVTGYAQQSPSQGAGMQSYPFSMPSGGQSMGVQMMPQGMAGPAQGTGGQNDMMLFAVPMMMGGAGASQGVQAMTAQPHGMQFQPPQQQAAYFHQFVGGQTGPC